MQELSIVMLEFRFDPTKANGASQKTVFYEVIQRNLSKEMRTRYRDVARLNRYARQMGVKADGTGEEPSCHLSAPLDIDVVLVSQGLSEFDQKVCRGITSSKTRAAIARELECEWGTVNRALRRIRKYFTECGLNGWVV